MLKWLKTDWREIRKGILIGVGVVILGCAATLLYVTHRESVELTPAYPQITDESSTATSTDDGSIYFVSGNETAGSCPVGNIDWDIAVAALSDYVRLHPNADFGPSEIQRHFAENCESDLEIYRMYLKNN